MARHLRLGFFSDKVYNTLFCNMKLREEYCTFTAFLILNAIFSGEKNYYTQTFYINDC